LQGGSASAGPLFLYHNRTFQVESQDDLSAQKSSCPQNHPAPKSSCLKIILSKTILSKTILPLNHPVLKIILSQNHPVP
jgi:hypothetical protein